MSDEDEPPPFKGGLFNDDGSEINPALVVKPSLCVTCRKDGLPGEEEILCTLNRAACKCDDDFQCGAYERKENQA